MTVEGAGAMTQERKQESQQQAKQDLPQAGLTGGAPASFQPEPHRQLAAALAPVAPQPRARHQPHLSFWFDFASNYSWLAARRIGALAAQAGVTLAWKPFLLGPIFAAQGWNDSPFNIYPAKGAYGWRDITRAATAMGLAVRKPDPFPQNSLQAARVALALPPEATPAFTVALFAAQFEAGLGLTDEALHMALAAAGVNLDAALTAAASIEIKQALRQRGAEAASLGLFGAPSFVTSDGEVFWGNDRLEQALAWECALAAEA